MLSSITPLSERSRGNRYWVTFAWFLFGCLLGGLTLGALGALGALAVGGLDLPASPVVLVAAALALASDLGIGGLRLPHNPRQVNRAWLDRYRSWVYAIGFVERVDNGGVQPLYDGLGCTGWCQDTKPRCHVKAR